MLWKMPARETLTIMNVWRFRETENAIDEVEVDAESVPATTISMGMFLTTYLRGGGVAAAASRRRRLAVRMHSRDAASRTGPGSPG